MLWSAFGGCPQPSLSLNVYCADDCGGKRNTNGDVGNCNMKYAHVGKNTYGLIRASQAKSVCVTVSEVTIGSALYLANCPRRGSLDARFRFMFNAN